MRSDTIHKLSGYLGISEQNLGTYGSRGCTCQAGCCGSCCKDSFDEDTFEDQVRKDMEKTRDPNASVHNPQQQPMASEPMAM